MKRIKAALVNSAAIVLAREKSKTKGAHMNETNQHPVILSRGYCSPGYREDENGGRVQSNSDNVRPTFSQNAHNNGGNAVWE